MIAFLLVAAMAFGSQPDTPERLRARISTETNPVQKARLEIRLADLLLEQTRKQYTDGDDDKGLASLNDMMTNCESAYQQLFGTHRDPRSKPAGFKDTEIRMREFVRRLNDLRLTLASDERPPLDKAIERLRDMHDDLLSGIMRVRKKENP